MRKLTLMLGNRKYRVETDSYNRIIIIDSTDAKFWDQQVVDLLQEQVKQELMHYIDASETLRNL
jgi:hypothetical protein